MSNLLNLDQIEELKECSEKYRNGRLTKDDMYCFEKKILKGFLPFNDNFKTTYSKEPGFDSSFPVTSFEKFDPVPLCNYMGGLSCDNQGYDDIKIFNPIETTTKTEEKGSISSLVHIIVIPTKERIYNAITLKPEDKILVDKMESEGLKIACLQRATIIQYINYLFIRYINSVFKENKRKKKVLQEDLWKWLSNSSGGELKSEKTWLDSITKNGFKFENGNVIDDNPEKGIIIKGADMTEKCAKKFRIGDGIILSPPSEYITGFHVHPNHSVGLLHMHIIDKSMLTIGSEHNIEKTVNIPFSFLNSVYIENTPRYPFNLEKSKIPTFSMGPEI